MITKDNISVMDQWLRNGDTKNIPNNVLSIITEMIICEKMRYNM